MTHTIGIILGSIREGRAGESVANWVKEQADARTTGVEYRLIDLKEFNIPVNSSPVVPGAANKQYDDPAVTAWSKVIDETDAFVFVTPEYNHSVPGPFKNAVDSIGFEWWGKPVAFVGYGSAGGVRAVEHWRTIVSNFQMVDVRSQLDFSLFTEFNEQGVAPNERRADELTAILDELERLTEQLNK